MARFERREAFCIEAGNQVSDSITACSSRKPGGLGKGMTVCHGQHFFGMDHLIRWHRQGTTEMF